MNLIFVVFVEFTLSRVSLFRNVIVTLMKHLLHIFLLALTAFFGASCQDVPAYSGLQTRQEVLVQKENNRDCLVRTDGGIRFREGTLTSTPSLCRTICTSEERAQPRSGECTSSGL